MFIQTLLPPVAGESFRFNVSGCAGATSIEVYVNSKQILNRKCDDLLCKTVTVIPNGTEGKTLSIYATDSAGNNKTLEYEISEAAPGAHSMLSDTR